MYGIGLHIYQWTVIRSFLCGRPTYASCASVCPSVCRVRTRNSKTKKRRKIKFGVDVSHCMNKWSANFQFERSKVKVTAHTASFWRFLRPVTHTNADCTLWPTPLLGLLYCRRLRPWATGRTAAYIVGADIFCCLQFAIVRRLTQPSNNCKL